MDAKELAARLTGREYPFEPTKDEQEEAKASGLVIVFGASDDLMEFRGAIYDEIDAYEGTKVYVDTEGLQRRFESISEGSIDALRDYFRREGKGVLIWAFWCQEGDYSWTYGTTIPHETFEIVEDGAPYCRGIIFALKDAQ